MDLIAEARKEAVNGRLPGATAQELAERAGMESSALMLALIPLAGEQAMPLLSGYQVGAVGEGKSGDLFFGANLEMPLGPPSWTVHGEQAVVINAMGHGEEGLARLAISATPCGVCRQFLYELSSAGQLQILLASAPPVRLTESLPSAFGPQDLDIEGGLMGSELNAVTGADTGCDELTTLACEAAAKAYTPYTGSVAGIAIRLSDRSEYCGFAIENAAFNPSLMPLQVAMSSLAMAGRSLQDITEAVQVELPGNTVSYRETTELLLRQIAPGCSFRSHALTPSG